MQPPSERQVGLPDGNVVLDLYVLQQRIGELMELGLAGTDTRPAEYAVYSQLAGGPLSPRDLSLRLGLTPSTLTGHLEALTRRHHVSRIPHPHDGRSYRMALTEEGLAEAARCRRGFRRMLERLRSQLAVPEPDIREVLGLIDQAAARAAAQLRADPDPETDGPPQPH